MNAWNYKDDTPFIPVTLLGRRREIDELALVDSGARLGVLHEDHKRNLDLEKLDDSYTAGFGSKKRIPVEVCILSLKIADKIENVECIVLKERYYPESLSRIVLGRNLLNKFKIILDGKNKRLYLE